MEAYTSFAQVYDLFMDNVPYEEWCAYICETLGAHGIWNGTVVELGCGTGRLTRLMAARGFDMIGVDNSVDMLSMARANGGPEESILYLLQDMQKLELGESVHAIYSACDCVNYILEEEELLEVFLRVCRYLEPQGVFLFDMNTPYKYRELLRDNTFAENREEGSFIWENYFDEEERLNEYDLTLFIPEGQGLFRKFEETHCQRCYEIEQVRRLLGESGLELLGVYDSYTKEAVREDSERALFVAVKNVQGNAVKEAQGK